MKNLRVRYAPSPTGYLHIGNARTALFNYLFAKSENGKFIIRIEDTDVARNLEDGVSSQFDSLKWLGVDWDESIDKEGECAPYNQLKRFENGVYDEYINYLLENKKAYKCFCTSEELEIDAKKQKELGQVVKYNEKCRNLSEAEIEKLEKESESYTIRFKIEKNKEIKFNDMVKKNVKFNSSDVSGDFNIVKRDGIPTYNFVVVVDDHLMNITHVLRGEDHISNTPKQIMIYEALGFEIPDFCHMTLIVNENGKKLSKRDGGILQFIKQYEELGYLPEAMFNFIALLGWSPEGKKEIFSREEFIEIFDINRLSKSPAKFDVDKLTWINNQYMKSIDQDKYLNLVYPFIEKEYNVKKNSELDKVLLLYKNQISYGQEIVKASTLFFKDFEIDKESKDFLDEIDKENIDNLKKSLKEKISNIELEPEQIKQMIKEIQIETGLKGKMLFMPIRIILTGQMHGPELADTLSVIGREVLLKRIDINNG